MPSTTRRRVICAAAFLAAPLVPRWSNAVWAQEAARLEAEVGPALRRMARLLYPHDEVGDDVYAQVVADLLDHAARDASLEAMVTNAVRALDNAVPGNWLELGREVQIQGMRAVERQPFFARVRTGVRDRLYTDPRVWETLGYPGSSLEFGGYLNEGYDDIAWLPGGQ